MKQRTLRHSIQATGVGLHSGEPVMLKVSPASIDSGIRFKRVDIAGSPWIKAIPDTVNDTRLSSTMVVDGVKVGTVEHLMSAFAALGLDNLDVEVDAPEMPIMDGSSAPFLYLMKQAGVVEQNALKKFVRIKKVVEAQEGDKWVRLSPHEGYKVALTIAFNHPVFLQSNQTVEMDFSKTSYIEEISRARTFGFMHEVEMMRQHGLGLGGSLDNAIVLDEYSVLNPEGLRYADEFVRHKILDAVGDLYMLGYPIIGAFEGFKSGHALNNKLLRTLLLDTSAWEFATFSDDADLPTAFQPLCTLEDA